jgi:hypothetical protein
MNDFILKYCRVISTEFSHCTLIKMNFNDQGMKSTMKVLAIFIFQLLIFSSLRKSVNACKYWIRI